MNASSVECPGPTHQALVTDLETLALLSGHAVTLAPRLPDHRRPDVMRVNPCARSLFLGEAKSTEPPSAHPSQLRLNAYLDWVEGHVCAGGISCLAIAAADPLKAAR